MLEDVAAVLVRRRRAFHLRLLLLSCGSLLAAGGLGWRWHHLQIEQFAHFERMSADNQVTIEQVGPIRGLIYDRNGVVLAENHISYEVRVNSDNAPRVLEQWKRITPVLQPSERASARIKELASSGIYAGEVVLRDFMTEEDVIRFIDIQQDHPELVLDAKMVRSYPRGDSAAHIVGHVGRINPDDVVRLKTRGQWRKYIGSEFMGKRGVEAMYETRLHGTPGLREAQIDAHGRVLDTHQRVAPRKGTDLWLTIDYELQRVAEELLQGEEGSVVALDPHDGAVLAMVSSPRFDSNAFIGGVTQEQWEHFNSEEAGTPMVHRAIYGQYAPGSTIKPFLALAALEHGWRDLDYQYQSTGVFHLTPRHPFHDWKEGGHGLVDLPTSIIKSVNTFYYQLAFDVGTDAIHDALAVFGFGRLTGIDLAGERPGVLPTERWKEETFNEMWYPGDTIPIGVGQGYLEVTPLQQARAMALIANGGHAVTPHLVTRIGDIRLRPEPGRTALFAPANVRVVRDALAQVTRPGGTAYSRVGKDSAYPIAGKTGTAQVTRLRYGESGRVKNEDLPRDLRDHGWFVGFAPAYNPRIVVAAVVEHGGSGGRSAGPVVRQLMDTYLLNRRGMRFNIVEPEAQEVALAGGGGTR